MGDKGFYWGKEQQYVLDTLIKVLNSDTILAIPQDKGKWRMEVDASNYATGGILSQQQEDGTWHPIDFISKLFTPAQMNYATYNKEFLAIIQGLDKWQHYLLGLNEPFRIHTDHANLQYFQKSQCLNPRQTCWHSTLQNFNFEVKYRPGSKNTKADTLSQ